MNSLCGRFSVLLVLGSTLPACGLSEQEKKEIEARLAAQEETLAKEKADKAAKKAADDVEPPAVIAALKLLRERAKALVSTIPKGEDTFKEIPLCAKGKPPAPRLAALSMGVDTLRFLASDENHWTAKESGYLGGGMSEGLPWDDLAGFAADINRWAYVERAQRFAATPTPGTTSSPPSSAELRGWRKELVPGLPLATDGHFIVAFPADVPDSKEPVGDDNKKGLAADVVIFDPKNRPTCRIAVKSKARVHVFRLSGSNAGLQEAAEVEELRWQTHLALEKTRVPVKLDGELRDPTANAVKLPPLNKR